jgi:hypothetical protein
MTRNRGVNLEKMYGIVSKLPGRRISKQAPFCIRAVMEEKFDDSVLQANSNVLWELGWIAWAMESSFKIRIPYIFKTFKFGLSSVITILPIPNLIAANLLLILTIYIILRAKFSLTPDMPRLVIIRMVVNLGIGVLFGYIPFFGAWLLAWWKPNQTNVQMLAKSVPCFDYDNDQHKD